MTDLPVPRIVVGRFSGSIWMVYKKLTNDLREMGVCVKSPKEGRGGAAVGSIKKSTFRYYLPYEGDIREL